MVVEQSNKRVVSLMVTNATFERMLKLTFANTNAHSNDGYDDGSINTQSFYVIMTITGI